MWFFQFPYLLIAFLLVAFSGAWFFNKYVLPKMQDDEFENDSDFPEVREKFPKILADRIVRNTVISPNFIEFKESLIDRLDSNELDYFLSGAFLYSNSPEGSDFWLDIQYLYRISKSYPLSGDIIKVFQKHGVKI